MLGTQFPGKCALIQVKAVAHKEMQIPPLCPVLFSRLEKEPLFAPMEKAACSPSVRAPLCQHANSLSLGPFQISRVMQGGLKPPLAIHLGPDPISHLRW